MTTEHRTAAEAALHRAWANARAIPHDPDDPACRCLSCNSARAAREPAERGGRRSGRHRAREAAE